MNPTITQAELDACKGHTPGEWGIQGLKKSEVAGGQKYWTIHVPGTYDAVGFFYPRTPSSNESQEANAALISIAPKLLEGYESQAKLLEEANKLLYNTMSVLNERGCEHTATTIYKFLSRVEKHTK